MNWATSVDAATKLAMDAATSEPASNHGQAAEAIEEIGQQIATIPESMRGAVGAIQGISAVIIQINEIAATRSAAVEEEGVDRRAISPRFGVRAWIQAGCAS